MSGSDLTAYEAVELISSMSTFCRQRCVLKGTELDVSRKSLTRFFEATIPLEVIDLRPVRQKTRPTNCLWIALVLLIVGLLSVGLGMTGPRGSRGVATDFSIFGGLLILGAAGFVLGFFLRAKDFLIFFASNGSVAFALPYGQPTVETFAGFVEELRSRAERRKREVLLETPEVMELDRLLRERRVSAAQLRRMTAELLEADPDVPQTGP